MIVTYKIKKKVLYEGAPYRIKRTTDDTLSGIINIDLLIVAVQAMISEKNSNVKESS